MNNVLQMTTIVNKYLKLSNVKVSENTVSETIQNHPKPDSLACIKDVFNEMGVENLVLEFNSSENDKLLELPTPFISHLVNDEFIIVTNTSDKYVEYYSSATGEVKEHWSIFQKQYTGIALVAFPLQNTLDTNTLSLKSVIQNNQKYFGNIIALLFVVSIASFMFNIYNDGHKFLTALLMLKLLGLVITSLLIFHEFQQNDSFVHKVCKANKMDCDVILKDEDAKLFGLISWSDLGFIYFSGGLLAIIMRQNIFLTIDILFLINIPCVLFSFYSLWFQLVKTEKLCLFCMGVLAVFWLEFGFFMFFIKDINLYNAIRVSDILSLSLGFLLPIAFLLVAKPIWLKYNHLKTIQTNFNKIKFNENVVKTLSESNPLLSTPESVPVLAYGNKTDKNNLTIVTNPNCGPCVKEYETLKRYMNGCYDDLQINFIFWVSPLDKVKNSEKYKVTKRLLALYKNHGAENTLKAMNDWYTWKMSLEDWSSKYPVENEDSDDLLTAQYEWCQKNDIKYTPTTFFNNRELSNHYSIDDVKYLLA